MIGCDRDVRIILAVVMLALAMAFLGFISAAYASMLSEWRPLEAAAELMLNWPESGVAVGCISIGLTCLVGDTNMLGHPNTVADKK